MAKQKPDTPYKGSWADTVKTTDWKSLQPKPIGILLKTISNEEYRQLIGLK